MGLDAMRERNPLTLSGGEKKKLLLACLFAVDPQLWLLDETLEELDAASRTVLLDYVKKRGTTVLLASAKWHDVFGEYADRVLLLEDGAVEPLVARPGSKPFAERLERTGLTLPASAPAVASPSAGAEARAGAGPESDRGGSEAAEAAPRAENRVDRGRTVGGRRLIRVRGLSFRYPEGGSFRLEVPGLEIREGEVVALIGPNGSGKTTLGRILCGLLEPQKGSVEILQGDELRPAAAEQLNRYTGYLFQDPDLQIFLPTVADELGYGLRLRGLGPEEIERTVSDAIGRFRLPGPEVPPALMSYGSRKRLQAAVCYLLERPVLVVDEGDSGLGAREFAGLLRQLRSAANGRRRVPERGLMFITHDLHVAARLADRVVRLQEGKPE
jgi:energy-coupling factor transport system ATP-binding protein